MMDKSVELELISNYATKKCRHSIGRLLISYLPLIKREVRRHRASGFSQDELTNEGVIGFCKAVNCFDSENFEGSLGQYASHYIKREISDFVFNNERIVKTIVTREQRRLISNIRRLTNSLGDMTYAECKAIAEAEGVSVSDVRLVEAFMTGRDMCISASDSLNFYRDSDEWVDWEVFLSSETSEDLVIMNEQEAMLSAVSCSIKSLESREAEIINARWFSDKKETMKSLGNRMSISIERVRQIESRAIQKISDLANTWMTENSLK